MLQDGLLVLLSIKGFAKVDGLAEILEIDGGDVERELARLASNGEAEETKIGWRLTQSGKSAAAAYITQERTAAGLSEMDDVYETFTVCNDRFKTTIMRWQVRTVGGSGVPNDHSDAAYDQSVIDELRSIHAEIDRLLERIARGLPRANIYRRRFERALEKISRGERRFVAAPIIDSYHTVWFELHEDLIRLAGRNRKDEAAAGRGA